MILRTGQGTHLLQTTQTTQTSLQLAAMPLAAMPLAAMPLAAMPLAAMTLAAMPLASMTHAPVAGIVLAAGFSRRMGCDKLLLPLPTTLPTTTLPTSAVSPSDLSSATASKAPVPYTELMIQRPVRAAQEAGLSPLLAVIRQDASPELVQALQDKAILVPAPLAHKGQAESLKAGLRALLELHPDCTGVMILLGDQPLVSASLLRQLVNAFVQPGNHQSHHQNHQQSHQQSCQQSCQQAIAPACAGVRGNPVILPRRAFEAVFTLEGDTGARALLADYDLHLVETGDRAALYDIDTWAAYESFV